MPSSWAEPACDIAIIGAGPAGAAAALTLRQVAPGLSVLLLEAETTPRPRVGEVLPAAGMGLLHRLGVAQAVAPACRPAVGMRSIWGSSEIVERPALLSARGADQHLDRGRFDHLLAEAAGARRGAPVASVEPDGDGWRLNGATKVRFVIWATGRQRALLKASGARLRNFDRLVGYLRYVAEPATGDARTLLEADPDGWWYAAALPGGVRGIAFMTDADLGRSFGLADAATWQARLEQTELIGTTLQWGGPPRPPCRREPAHVEPAPGKAGYVPAGGHGGPPHWIDSLRSEICAAGSSLLEPCCGPNWIAAGDAASVYQPLAAHGITKALRTGAFAAYAAIDVLAGRGEAALARYAGLIQRDFAAYRSSLAGHYAAETRWSDRPFWARRRSAEAA